MSVSSRRVSVWLLLILLPVAGYVGWYNYREYSGANEGPVPEAPNPKWKYATEEHWLVDETARDITEMLVFAKNGRIDGLELVTTPDKKARESFEISAKWPDTNVKANLVWKEYLWSPAEWAPWAEKVKAALKLEPTAPATNDPAI